MDFVADNSELLADIERRQEDVLRQLANLEESIEQVWAWANEAGVLARYEGKGWPGELLDFARMMDDQ